MIFHSPLITNNNIPLCLVPYDGGLFLFASNRKFAVTLAAHCSRNEKSPVLVVPGF
jgi:hypothetical protein